MLVENSCGAKNARLHYHSVLATAQIRASREKPRMVYIVHGQKAGAPVEMTGSRGGGQLHGQKRPASPSNPAPAQGLTYKDRKCRDDSANWERDRRSRGVKGAETGTLPRGRARRLGSSRFKNRAYEVAFLSARPKRATRPVKSIMKDEGSGALTGALMARGTCVPSAESTAPNVERKKVGLLSSLPEGRVDKTCKLEIRGSTRYEQDQEM